MPFRVHYEIFDNKHAAPDFQTYDYTMARIEWSERQRDSKGLLWRLEQTVMPDGVLTKHEEYVHLVYRVRRLTAHYRNNGQKPEDRNILMEHVRKLDKENRRTREFLNAYPAFERAKLEAKSSAFMFFVLVEAWRNAYYERQKYSKVQDYDYDVFREMTRKIRQLEKEIDEYIKQTIKLI